MFDEKKWAQEVSDKIYEKVKVTLGRNRHKIPYTTIDGVFDDMTKNISWWTNGFFAGQLWRLYVVYGNEEFRLAAEEIEEKLDRSLMDYEGMDHDSGFKWLPTAVANYKITGNQQSRNRGLLAAANLAGRFNPAGKFIRAWNNWGEDDHAGWAIIDCMMNLPLLYWAEKETNDPRFKQIAMLHADTAMNTFVREDGSVNHIVMFNPETGEMTGTLGGQGYKEGSSWTRGQAWAVYGFTLSYMYTGKQEYLDTAKKVADYYINNIPDSGFIPVDFRQPKECTFEDSTAAAIAASGFLELEKYVPSDEKQKYHRAAIKLLYALEESRCNWTMDTDNIVEKCTAAYHDQKHEFAIIYGDYYFTEAILKLMNERKLSS